MRIISKKRDYYDSGAMFGVDMTTVYHRKKEIVDRNHPLYQPIKDRFRLTFSALLEDHILLRIDRFGGKITRVSLNDFKTSPVYCYVAGKKYRGLKVTESTRNRFTYSEVIYFFWSFDDFYDKVVEWADKQEIDIDQFVATYSEDFYTRDMLEADRDFFVENKIVSLTPRLPDDFSWGAICLINSDSLAELGLSRIVDPVTMFSQIDQWVSSFNDTTRTMVEISDKDKITKHGMDHTSFRKPKQTT